MITIRHIFILSIVSTLFYQCSKKGSPDVIPPPVVPANFGVLSSSVDEVAGKALNYDVDEKAAIKFTFNAVINRSSVLSGVSLKTAAGSDVTYNLSYAKSDSMVIIQPSQPLNNLAKYTVAVSSSLKSVNGGSLTPAVQMLLYTSIDSSRKFPVISDDALLTLIQQQTFKYFWDFGHPTSGLARERNTSGDLVTSGGSGFGIMSIVTGIDRNFISKADGLARMQKIVSFLKNTAQKFHGAFPHWLDGNTGAVIPFSAKDDGADLVETSFLVQGLLTARQYFSGADAAETALRTDINTICNGVEWNWFQKNNEDVLYWHWSPTYNWDMNHKSSAGTNA